MPGKKPGSKISKPRKAAPVKVVARKPEPRKPAAASRKAVAAATAKPAAVKPAPKPAADRKADTHRPEHHAMPRASAAAPAAPAHGPLSPASSSTANVHTARLVPPPAEADEGDGSDPSGLLAGPRNVKPYVAKRGEQYMSKQQLAHFQQILSNWKRDLMQEVDRTVSHMKDEAANFPDPNDRATQEEEFSLELRTRDRERKLIRKIEEALKRIEDGTYGYCLETGEEIGIKRLEARPVATLSIEAQERRERRERQYGDRDDRYR
jgi:RNA polymerase-binding transcription factor